MRRSLGRLHHARDLDLDELEADARAQLPGDDWATDARVTVVISTYNRSDVLRHALASVVAQTSRSWRIIVVGDACTDDTGAVVASIGDPRVAFVNLARNTGDQSGPNSVGARLAQTPHVAWLNHDDMWLPDHLESLLEVARQQRADVVAAAWYTLRGIDDDGRFRVTRRILPRRFALGNHESYLSSGLLVRTAFLRRVGDWKPATAVRYASSQEFVYRCWALGARIVTSREPSFVVIPSTIGVGTYGKRAPVEHHAIAPTVVVGREAIRRKSTVLAEDPRRVHTGVTILERELTPRREWLKRHSELIYRLALGPITRLGHAPWEFSAFLAGASRGETNDILRSMRGLPVR